MVKTEKVHSVGNAGFRKTRSIFHKMLTVLLVVSWVFCCYYYNSLESSSGKATKSVVINLNDRVKANKNTRSYQIYNLHGRAKHKMKHLGLDSNSVSLRTLITNCSVIQHICKFLLELYRAVEHKYLYRNILPDSIHENILSTPPATGSPITDECYAVKTSEPRKSKSHVEKVMEPQRSSNQDPNGIRSPSANTGCSERRGRCSVTYINGDTYDGFWKSNVRHGYGTCNYTNGDKYSGKWINDKREGNGVYIFFGGDIYNGMWHNDTPISGCYIWANSGNKYSGSWVAGQPEGNGEFCFGSTSVSGHFSKGQYCPDYQNSKTEDTQKYIVVVLPDSSYSNYKIDYADLEFGELIGKGAFGKVFQGKYLLNSVAIKVVQQEDSAQTDFSEVKNLILANNIRKNNDGGGGIIDFFGYSELESRTPGLPRELLIVTEFMNELSLDRFARSTQWDVHYPSLTSCFNPLLNLANALHLLHENNMLHRDIKPQNILVTIKDNECVWKWGDFGAAHPKDQPTSINLTGTRGFLAPELLEVPEQGASRPYSVKSDMYATGITIGELFVLKADPENTDFKRWTERGALQKDARLRPFIAVPKNLDEEFCDFIRSCWSQDPTLRPESSKLCWFLSKRMEK